MASSVSSAEISGKEDVAFGFFADFSLQSHNTVTMKVCIVLDLDA
jgi:hypothetical protein